MEEQETVNEEINPQGVNTPQPNTPVEPPIVQTRGQASPQKSNIDYILQRKEAKIAKLEAKLAAVDSEEPEEQYNEDNETVVERVLERKYGNVLKSVQNNQIEQEVNSFLAQNPQYIGIEGFESKFKAYAKHPSRQNVPLASIALDVAGFENIARIGASMTQQADSKASQNSIPGTSYRKETNKTPTYDTSLEGIEKLKREMGI